MAAEAVIDYPSDCDNLTDDCFRGLEWQTQIFDQTNNLTWTPHRSNQPVQDASYLERWLSSIRGCIAVAGMLMLNCGRPRSRKVRIKPSRQARLSVSKSARKERGNPPRSQSVFQAVLPVSERSKPLKLMRFHPPSQRLRGAADQLGRSAAQDNKATGLVTLSLVFGPVHKYPQGAEQFRHLLDFVQNNQALQTAQHQLRILQAALIG